MTTDLMKVDRMAAQMVGMKVEAMAVMTAAMMAEMSDR